MSVHHVSNLKQENVSLHNQLTSAAISKVKAMIADSQMRLHNYEKQLSLIDRGIFYPQEYAEILVNMKQNKRHEFFKNRGTFHHGYTQSTLLDRIQGIGTKFLPYVFTLKKEASASAALAEISSGLSLISCGEVCDISYYSALQETLGKEKFDALFSSNSPTPFSICVDKTTLINPLSVLTVTFKESNLEKTEQGDVCYFTNQMVYQFKHLFGNGSGYNMMRESDIKPLFYGLGFSCTGVTPLEIQNTALAEYNKNPLDSSLLFTPDQEKQVIDELLHKAQKIESPTVSATFVKGIKMSKSFAMHTFTVEQFQTNNGGGGLLKQVTRFRFERVEALKESSTEKGLELLCAWKLERTKRA